MADTNTFVQFLLLLILSSGFLHLETVKLGSCNGSHDASCMEIERKALLNFKEGLTDPSGRLSAWVGKDCCRWDGVKCSNKSGHVIKLKLRNLYSGDPDVDGAAYALGGEISTSLLNLKHLEYLDLSMNNFGGIPIPKFIGSLKILRYLNFSGASFGGTIPPHLGNLSSLRYLDLNGYFDESHENKLNWLSDLSSLKYLNLGSVDLSEARSDWLQSVNMLPSLLELHLPACRLSNFPLSLPFVNLTSLLVLDLSNNGFNSSIPSWLFNLSSLVYLDLQSNTLQGVIPDDFVKLTALQHVDLSQNYYIEGKLPRTLGKLCKLQVLDLSVNSISGDMIEVINDLGNCSSSDLESLQLDTNKLGDSLPNSLGRLKHLKHLSLGENSFVGSIPESIGNLSSLEEFYLSSNQMKGTIPSSLGQLSALVAFDFSFNQWEGVIIEAHFSNLTSLKEISITQSFTNITLVFNISTEWIPPFTLTYLNLKSCQLGPKFPAWLRTQNELNSVVLMNAKLVGIVPEWFWKLDLLLGDLDLSYNQLSGRLPTTIKFLPQSKIFLNNNTFEGPLPLLSSNASVLHLNNNLFSGPIPMDIGERMPMLTDLDISYNCLNGTIPTSISKLSSLATLVVSDNHLTGKIPDFWNDLPDIYVIYMSNNSLSGEIPSSLGSLSSLRFLMLSYNDLSGELPFTLQNCINMQTLDLGDNRLSGMIPGWIAERMPSLLILSLRSNLFIGDIPTQICSLSSLHILDIANNNLSGPVPDCVGNLTGMASVLDSIRYEGQLWLVVKGRTYYYEGNLCLVNSIDLSSNNLSGDVPEGLKNLSRLGTLNLSMNHLTGQIPANIGSLQLLETLDLSKNHLTGTIPPSMASMTSLNHLNLSYNNLSGVIPSTNQFQTFNDPSIYEGNPALCGLPLPTKCNGDDETSQPPSGGKKEDDNEDEFEKLWFYLSIALGFFVGFWGVCGSLIIKKSWRIAYFRFVDDMKERLMVVVFHRN